jgi:fibro-slime domain-containing protein
MRSKVLSGLCIAAACTSLGACAGVKPLSPSGTGGTGGNDASVVAPHQDGSPSFDIVTADISITPQHSVCGDGVRSQDEACDDGNAVGDDGCAANCLTVDPGFSCTPPGQPCHRIARCGDGVAVLPELCDDGNVTAGDGCSDTCKIELGWKCSGSPSKCSHTTCGDKKVEGAEGCDVGDALPFDGCSATCQNEPDCKTATNGSCMSRCGDGIVVNEACDDGNNVDGDGCSAACKIEPGFMCKQPALGDKMVVPAVFRDFRAKMPADFEPSASGRMTAVTGMVQAMLDTDGKPVYVNVANSLVTSATTFSQWYRDTPGVNHTTAGTLTLWSNGQGQYVNRYGPNGEQWILTAFANYCGNVGGEMIDPTTGMAIPCTSRNGTTECDRIGAMGLMRVSCTVMGNNYQADYEARLDGTPFFFPVDADTFTPLNSAERVAAQAAPPYANWEAEAGGAKHNFHFTSEVRYWFQYDSAQPYVLDFTGDDDVWVFINRRLAVDLGSIHTPVQGSVRFGMGQAAANTKFNLTNGQFYEVVVFQAERQTVGSSYRLTLSGFNAAPSECRPVCGDAIIGIGEECDDGKNAGGYGVCGPGCKLGEYCGDGIVQTDYEDCDDGVNIGMPCPSGCKRLIVN